MMQPTKVRLSLISVILKIKYKQLQKATHTWYLLQMWVTFLIFNAISKTVGKLVHAIIVD